MGNLLIELGRPEEALARYDRALALNPSLMQALVGRAQARQSVGRFVEALGDCDKALQLSPGNPAALNNKVVCLLGLDQFALALAAADQALAVRPDSANTLSNKAGALLGLKHDAEALAAAEQALGYEPRHAQALCNKGAALSALGRQDDALAAYDAALAVDARLSEAWVNRATPLRYLERYDDALASTGRALAVTAPRADILRARGIAQADLGRAAEALESFDRALQLAPHDAEAMFNKAQMLMRGGDFASGLPLYEARKRLPRPVGARIFAQPLWLGEPDIAGKTLFVHWEQGLGDVLMFSRFVPLLADRGAQVILSVPQRLTALFASFDPRVTIIGDAVPEVFDFHVPMASLMLALGVTAATIAPPAPLTPDAPRLAQWQARIGGQGRKVAIAWQGAKVYNDVGRSFPVALFREIAALEGVRLISLQKNDGIEQLASLPDGMTIETLGADFDSGPDAFLDTAAVMQACDMVITSDTSIAHLAGALGRPVWVALRHSPEWRWFLGREDSPWYPTARLFRQPVPGDWASVFAQMTDVLRQAEH
jgi:tetratricopeptide (TPR) repeat protein